MPSVTSCEISKVVPIVEAVAGGSKKDDGRPAGFKTRV
jgi:hypothetical protein